MPYIDPVARERLAATNSPQTPGELNYCITQVIKSYMKGHVLNYQMINDINGAVEGAKLEFYRRVAAPYEDKKIQDNGDVYDTI